MYPSDKVQRGWKWARYRCKKCSADVPHNQRGQHLTSKHIEEWRAFKGVSIDELYAEFYEVIRAPY